MNITCPRIKPYTQLPLPHSSTHENRQSLKACNTHAPLPTQQRRTRPINQAAWDQIAPFWGSQDSSESTISSPPEQPVSQKTATDPPPKALPNRYSWPVQLQTTRHRPLPPQPRKILPPGQNGIRKSPGTCDRQIHNQRMSTPRLSQTDTDLYVT